MQDYEVIYIDLDETLYPKTNGLWRSISDRINQFLVHRLLISLPEAQELRKHYLDTFGTTLNGLLKYYDIDPIEYLEYVHDIPVEVMIQPEPELRGVIKQLSARRFIFTNASIQHANRVLRHLNIQDLFDGIIDILALEFVNKPRIEAYQKALALSGNPNPIKCILIDDRIANLIPAKEIGMTTVLVGETVEDSSIDFMIDSMNDILREVPGLK
jgi:putative hydrolase of the HAD superfamily